MTHLRSVSRQVAGPRRSRAPVLTGFGLSTAVTAGMAAAQPGLTLAGGVAFLLMFTAGAAVLILSPQAAAPLAYLCIALMFLDLTPVSFGASVRAYHPISLVLAAGLLHHAHGRVQLGPLFKWLVLFTLAVSASLLWTTSLTDTAVVTVGQVYLLYIFVMVCSYLSCGIVTTTGVLNALLVGAATSSLFALLQFAASYVDFYWQIHDVHGIPWHRPAGLMLEPDWAGLAAAVGLLIAFFRPVGSAGRTLAIAICGAAVVLTAVRAVWVALAVVALVGLVSARPIRERALRAAPVLGAGVLVLVSAVVVNPEALSRFSPSAVATSQGDTGALASRLGVLNLVYDRAGEAWLQGHGAGSLNYETTLQENREEYVGGGELNTGRGSTNLFATSFWDLGLPGLLIVVGLTAAWVRASWRLADQLPVLFPLTTLLLVDFQINNGIRFGFVWVILAVVSYAVWAHSPRGSPQVRQGS